MIGNARTFALTFMCTGRGRTQASDAEGLLVCDLGLATMMASPLRISLSWRHGERQREETASKERLWQG